MLEEIYVAYEDYPEIIKEGKTQKERKELLWRCYACNPKKEEVENMSLEDMIEYMKETDPLFDYYKNIIDNCVKLIKEVD